MTVSGLRTSIACLHPAAELISLYLWYNGCFTSGSTHNSNDSMHIIPWQPAVESLQAKV